MIVLAIAWRLSADQVSRFENLLPLIQSLYGGVSVVIPPQSDPVLIKRISQIANIRLLIGTQPNENRRYLTLRQALEFEQATHIHYCDGDHVISRLGKYPEDWKAMLRAIQETDCLIVGRSQAVFESYPAPLRETEAIINLVASHLLGQPVDLGSGSRGFNRTTAQYLIDHASPRTHGVATDAEWPVLLHHAGYKIDSYISDGAIYEVMDEAQRAQLESPEQWAKRVRLAHLIISAGLKVVGPG